MKKIGIFIILSLISFNFFSQTTIYSNSFETGLGGWTQSTSDNFDWTRKSGGTPTSNTGPSGAANGSYYLYTEADSHQNQTASLESPSFYLNGSSPVFKFYYHMYGSDMGNLFVEISTDGGVNYPTEIWSNIGQTQTSNGAAWIAVNLNLNAYIGQTIKIRISGVVGNGTRSDMAIDNISLTLFPYASQEINILGISTSIVSGDVTPSISDGTDFGTTNVGEPVSRTFTIQNLGSATLNLTGSPIVSISGSSTFTITQPSSNTILSGGSSLTFVITYSPLIIGTSQLDISISNNDTTGGENPYTFRIAANAEQNFFDSDGDGIFDNIDIDDDNDGIRDVDEELSCRKSSVAGKANYKFLNETFGQGARTTINTTYAASTTYCYEDGTGGTNTGYCPTLSSPDLNDGEYTVGQSAQIASWAPTFWYMGGDHTGDSNGRMALFNASYQPGLFYSATIKGALPNIPITYSFWAINLDRTDATGIATRFRPNIKVVFKDKNGNILTNLVNGNPAIITTGDLPPTTNGNLAGDWNQFTADLTFNVSEFYVYFYNNAPGGLGNDLALDDIIISQTLCDTDSDGVADVFDLDSDNDGIPDAVESNSVNAALSNGFGVIKGANFIDANHNGMNDASESTTPIDTDGDGVPNYLDLDSDNDGVFDVDESGVVSASAPSGTQNGDGDINGDGKGDGPDTDANRETDTNSDGILEYFTDGILDKYDYYNGASFASSYGNVSQGTGPLYVKDTDGNGIPDYMDPKSNGSTFDINTTLHSNTNRVLAGLPLLDSNNDGVIDNKTDTDGDGIPDVYDTDNTKFGSPRDYDQKLELYFDGRNDYAEDVSSVLSGLSNASLMGWIKIDPTATGDMVLFGQNNFYIKLLSSKKIQAIAGAKSVTSTSTLNTNQWIHIAAIYSSATSLLILYINGVNEGTVAVSGNLSSDTSHFTLGRQPDTNSNYYKGYMDEVRSFNTDLTADELHKMIYQEIQKNGGNLRGAVIPRDVTNYVNTTTTPVTLPWANLTRYFRMDVYKDDIIDDLTTPTIDVGTGAKIYNMKIIDPQTAPLPFVTIAGNTSLPTAINNPTNGILGTDATTYDWSIVKIQHNNITYNANQKHVGLFVDSPNKFSIQNDSELNISWYLKIDGFVDLEGESQLVQGDDSMLDQNSGGYIDRDQQGTANSFNYNYWSSSVGPITSGGTANGVASTNTNFTIGGVLEDGTDATIPNKNGAISFGAPYTWADAGVTSPIKISSYWLYKFNGTDNDYGSWVAINQNSSLLPGEGYTMKGTSGSVAINTLQNYVFKGKPYNGTINLSITTGNDRLVGNPYPSAIDANEFIKDNISTSNGGRNTTGNIFNGAVYFWDHFGEINTHVLKEYVGGYATYTLMGGVKAIANDARINTISGLLSWKIPKRYIPVNQGFFVIAALDALTPGTTPTINGGNIVFKNSQRIFETESSGNSIFMKATPTKKGTSNYKNTSTVDSISGADTRPKIWLEYISPKGYHRQLLVGADQNATDHFDFGYDAPIADENSEDMFWMVDGGKLVIQAVENFDNQKVLPLGLIVAQDGQVTIKIDSVANFDIGSKIFLKDNLSGKTYNLENNSFQMLLNQGTYANRFELSLKTSNTLGISENTLQNSLSVFMNNQNSLLQVTNILGKRIKEISLYNSLGQLLRFWDKNLSANEIYEHISIVTGVYIVKINTENGIITKKVVVEP